MFVLLTIFNIEILYLNIYGFQCSQSQLNQTYKTGTSSQLLLIVSAGVQPAYELINVVQWFEYHSWKFHSQINLDSRFMSNCVHSVFVLRYQKQNANNENIYLQLCKLSLNRLQYFLNSLDLLPATQLVYYLIRKIVHTVYKSTM